MEGGVVTIAENGMFEITNSTFSNNHAISGVIVNIFDSSVTSTIKDSVITDNVFVSKDTVIDEISNSCSML